MRYHTMKKCDDTCTMRYPTIHDIKTCYALRYHTTPCHTMSYDTIWLDCNSTGRDDSALPCDTYKYGETTAWPDMPLIGPFRQGRKIQVWICFSFHKFLVDKIALGLLVGLLWIKLALGLYLLETSPIQISRYSGIYHLWTHSASY